MMGECLKCAMKVKMVKSKVARLEDSQEKVYEVSAFQDVIEVIIQDADTTDDIHKMVTLKHLL